MAVDLAGPRQGRIRDLHQGGLVVEAISDPPMLNDMDADYSQQCLKRAWILRDQIGSGEGKHVACRYG